MNNKHFASHRPGQNRIDLCNTNGYTVYMKKKSANLHIRIPADLKREAEKVIDALGLDTSSAIRLFYTQLTLQQTLPFPLPKIRKATRKTERIVARALKSGFIGPFDSADAVLKALYADN